MLYTERAELILQQLQLQAVVKISDLAELMQVSVDTVRRDLKTMEQNGLVKCVRGGACLPESLVSLSSFSGREIINSDRKREAARKALKYVRPGSVIALNSGTTNTILAQELAARNDSFTVITNNLAAVSILMQNPSINPDTAFLSINAVNYQDGFTDFRFLEMGVIRLLAERAREVIAVMDSSKIGKRSRKKVLSLQQVDRMVTDDAFFAFAAEEAFFCSI